MADTLNDLYLIINRFFKTNLWKESPVSVLVSRFFTIGKSSGHFLVSFGSGCSEGKKKRF